MIMKLARKSERLMDERFGAPPAALNPERDDSQVKSEVQERGPEVEGPCEETMARKRVAEDRRRPGASVEVMKRKRRAVMRAFRMHSGCGGDSCHGGLC